MTQITIDADLASRLKTTLEPIELCDPTGLIVGRYKPVIDWSKVEVIGGLPTEEELDAIEKSADWVPHEEVLALLKRLEEGNV